MKCWQCGKECEDNICSECLNDPEHDLRNDLQNLINGFNISILRLEMRVKQLEDLHKCPNQHHCKLGKISFKEQ